MAGGWRRQDARAGCGYGGSARIVWRNVGASGNRRWLSDVTRILESIQQGDPRAADELLLLVYGELRKLATSKMANEAPNQTLQPTALVHEAWLRSVSYTHLGRPPRWLKKQHGPAFCRKPLRPFCRSRL